MIFFMSSLLVVVDGGGRVGHCSIRHQRQCLIHGQSCQAEDWGDLYLPGL